MELSLRLVSYAVKILAGINVKEKGPTEEISGYSPTTSILTSSLLLL
jgi:hypothetical protein